MTLLTLLPGWLSALAWCCGTTSGFFLAGSLIQGVIVELHPSFAAEPWRAYLLVVCLATIGALVNTYLSRKLPKLEGLAFILTISGFVSVIIVLWVLNSHRRLTASEVFQTFTNDGGWSSLGLSMVAGQILLVWTLTGQHPHIQLSAEHLLTANQAPMLPPTWPRKLNTPLP
jgi:choline transport protein